MKDSAESVVGNRRVKLRVKTDSQARSLREAPHAPRGHNPTQPAGGPVPGRARIYARGRRHSLAHRSSLRRAFSTLARGPGVPRGYVPP